MNHEGASSHFLFSRIWILKRVSSIQGERGSPTKRTKTRFNKTLLKEIRGQNSKPQKCRVFIFFFHGQAVQSFCSIPVVSFNFVVWFPESLLRFCQPKIGIVSA